MTADATQERPLLSARVAAELRAELARQRITGRELARRLGRSSNWASMKTSGAQRLSLDELEQVAGVLGLTAEDLVRRANPSMRSYPDSAPGGVLRAPVARPRDNRPAGRPAARTARPGLNRTAPTGR